ncbi:hypothetical protein D355_01710 [Enterococcus faecium SD1C-2]|nr:hypothetical protein D355_01710 [Enterococcus faecium SD1C-2]
MYQFCFFSSAIFVPNKLIEFPMIPKEIIDTSEYSDQLIVPTAALVEKI